MNPLDPSRTRVGSGLAAALVVGASCLLAALPSRANLLTNGSFEVPLVPVGSYTGFAGASTAIIGWTVVGSDVTVSSGSFSQNGITFQAQSGAQWLDVTGTSSNSTLNGVTQTVATAVGQAYQLDFYVGSATDGAYFFAATVDLSIDGGARTTYANPTAPTNAMNWKLFSTNFVAKGVSTTVTFYNGSLSSNYSSGLDNVSLTAVPEPSRGLLLPTGLAVMAFVRLRMKRLRA
jgi:hypothetical protein